ncbi:MAG: hypothetical protein QOE90_1436 [Thermoplasmata archaeon]|jgi:hypothetical protein|nr:hypothetical protein [Thermoplasmata archaeon]
MRTTILLAAALLFATTAVVVAAPTAMACQPETPDCGSSVCLPDPIHTCLLHCGTITLCPYSPSS